jgi:hypothetical protein
MDAASKASAGALEAESPPRAALPGSVVELTERELLQLRVPDLVEMLLVHREEKSKL